MKDGDFQVKIYTDGSIYQVNEHILMSGYSAIVCVGDTEKVFSGVALDLTSEKCEILGLNQALNFCKILKSGTSVIIYCDNTYVVNMYNKIGRYLPETNKDYWTILSDIKHELQNKKINIVVQWVRSHSGVYGNERADQEAKNVIDKYMKLWWDFERVSKRKNKVALSKKIKGKICKGLEFLLTIEKGKHLGEVCLYKDGLIKKKPKNYEVKYLEEWIDKIKKGGWEDVDLEEKTRKDDEKSGNKDT